jgi:hypothetical protein
MRASAIGEQSSQSAKALVLKVETGKVIFNIVEFQDSTRKPPRKARSIGGRPGVRSRRVP